MIGSFCNLRREFDSVKVGDRARNLITGAVVTVTWMTDRRKGEQTMLGWVDEMGAPGSNHWSKFSWVHGPIEEGKPDADQA